MMNVSTQSISSWQAFDDYTASLPGEWAFRGQTSDWSLSTSLERALRDWDLDLVRAPGLEKQFIREFRRHYRGDQVKTVHDDTLYCMSLMQQYGAPTRLLDWTYSPFVAAKFAMERGGSDAIVWCVRVSWCNHAAKAIVGEGLIAGRNSDKMRCDSSFLPLVMPELVSDSDKSRQFVVPENAMRLNDRLQVQQGLFLCPGSVSQPFEENLRAMTGWESDGNVVKLQFAMDRAALNAFALRLRRMNIHSGVLFPGLEGFCRSLRDRLPVIEDMAKRGIGGTDPIY